MITGLLGAFNGDVKVRTSSRLRFLLSKCHIIVFTFTTTASTFSFSVSYVSLEIPVFQEITVKFPVRPSGPGAALSGKEAIFEGTSFPSIFSLILVISSKLKS